MSFDKFTVYILYLIHYVILKAQEEMGENLVIKNVLTAYLYIDPAHNIYKHDSLYQTSVCKQRVLYFIRYILLRVRRVFGKRIDGHFYREICLRALNVSYFSPPNIYIMSSTAVYHYHTVVNDIQLIFTSNVITR